ncbi:addiction module toxin RelE [Candidatus Pacearchaeota archaeon]|nr:addiction module toxin RelE [Candidatus Pacearchaeota archaeon]
MPREYKTSKNFDRILDKLQKKDKTLFESLLKKMDEILNVSDVEHYKNLRYNMKDSKRVHVGSFVLIFQFDKSKNFISFDDFDHHDNVYVKR